MSVQHKNAALTKRHPVHNWEYANRTARLAAGGFSSADVGKLAIQTDDMSVWMLKDDSPATWTQILTLDSPGSGDDGKYLKYIHASRSYALDTPSGSGGGGGGGGAVGVGFDDFVDPGAVADWTWVNQGSATATKDPDDNSIVLQADFDTGDNWRMLVKSIPSTPYTITMAFQILLAGRNYCSTGLVLRDSGSGKIVNHGPGFDDSIEWCWRQINWTNPTTFSADAISGTQSRIPPGINMHWVRLTDDGTDRKFYVSLDGKYWLLIKSVSHSSFLTADQYGFGFDTNNPLSAIFKLYSVEVS